MAEGEKGTHNVEISDSDKKLDALADMIRDACSMMDAGMKRLDARMDAVEEKDRRSDAARKDEDEKEEKEKREDSRKDEDSKKVEEEGEPKEVAADRGRKDARKDESEDEKEEGDKREDARRRDSEEDVKRAERETKVDRKDARKDESEDEKEESMADHAPISRAEAAALRAEIARLNARAPAILADADRERFAAIQEQADPAFQAFGDRAPAPLDGETPTQYKRRLGTKLQAHSPKWKDTRLSSISDDATLDVIVSDVFADSIVAARKGVDVPAGRLRERVRSSGGHTIIEFEGAPESWMNDFAGHTLRGTGTFLRPH